jgi:hypothetical protein
MSLTIRCSEGWARWDPATTARNGASAYAGASIATKAALMQAACSQMPKAAVPAADAQPVRSNKPVLLLVGGADPADPPENSIDAPVELPNSITAVFPAGGHCVETYGCAPKLMTDFIDAGTAKGLDVSCAAQAPIPAFRRVSATEPRRVLGTPREECERSVRLARPAALTKARRRAATRPGSQPGIPRR